jgi:hypothetical protein
LLPPPPTFPSRLVAAAVMDGLRAAADEAAVAADCIPSAADIIEVRSSTELSRFFELLQPIVRVVDDDHFRVARCL